MKKILISGEAAERFFEKRRIENEEKKRNRRYNILFFAVGVVSFIIFCTIIVIIFQIEDRLYEIDEYEVKTLRYGIPEIIRFLIYGSGIIFFWSGLYFLEVYGKWVKSIKRKSEIKEAEMMFKKYSDKEIEDMRSFKYKFEQEKISGWYCEIELERRKNVRRFKYFINNILIWIIIAAVFFSYGYACAK